MNNGKMTRRALVLGSLGLAATGCTPVVRQAFEPITTGFTGEPAGIAPRLRKQRVAYSTSEPPGTIVVNTYERYLYAVEPDGMATRYGIGVGEEGLSLKGRASIGRKEEWPSWTPTASMMKRKPRLLQYAGGVPGGPDNPLGAAALYLYRGNQDTMFRVHGTNEPWSIGRAVSNGCIRLTNQDAVDLYERTPLGTPVVII
ncbi:oxidoreductase [Phyllobacterium brassicacearum]|uniref:Oxidoreductase n=1 Tax=Phyllobacterium brassicacearum TaxID=314235 RepID=A0A2P7BGJ1_9HYPH|nr:L,D-transpeptidase [Phyllobacterium brassicacearum]PSH65545.1 oxidoreductase [Phyllobacterium brassicacearum]TDQ20781.1 L,D-transpeptidase-like protein [Phyllobacterium brassicacearum]